LDEPEEYIDFMAKYKDWISIRRLGIRPDTKPEEIVHHMAGVRSVIDNKSYLFLGIKTGVLDEYAGRLTSGMRKGYESLSKAVQSMSGSETKSVLENSCENKELTPIAEAYLLSKVVTNLGYDTGINQVTMSKIFPYLKMPKAPGLGRKKKNPEQS
jgi:hypothetical protein